MVTARVEPRCGPISTDTGFTISGATASAAANAISGSAAGMSSRTLERSERFDVMGVGEEVEEVERGEPPAGRGQPVRVAGEGYRIA